LIELDGEYYYVRTSGAVATGYYYVNKPNGLLEAGFYTFDEDGKMIRETAKNGVVDGFYYIDGVIQEGAGLIELDGEYYYVRTSGAVATGYYYVNKPNGLLEAGFYTFGEDGKMIRETAKNGVIDGYYYIDGVMQVGTGLIEIDGDYYYVRSNGAVATGEYWVYRTNDLVSEGMYTFDSDGKMIR
ncbi:MAG: hypothetical protein IJP34_05555, partial [Clostridia bacterium]|nr:hypothetical protein [Clostridia bacterium]